MKKLYLASASPRRKRLIKKIKGWKLFVLRNDHDENENKRLPPGRLAVHHAREKAQKAAPKVKSGTIVAADTIVVCAGKILGKPKNKKDAARMLRVISNKVVRVITGIAVMRIDRGMHLPCRTGQETTLVKIKKLSKDEIDAYVKTREPLDKAGAFAIQGRGAFLVERIKGDYDNVVGLPIKKLKSILEGQAAACPYEKNAKNV
ncbi:MAG: Maf family protein [Candidatus Margulisiibacteriota bacterium]